MEDFDTEGYIRNFRIVIKKNISENEGFNMHGSAVIVMWSCLFQLLSKCRREGCGAQVNPDNMISTRNGTNILCKRTFDL